MGRSFYFTFVISILVTFVLAFPFFMNFAPPRAQSTDGFIPYEAASFSETRASGKTVVVHVHASWCPACKQQVPVLKALAKEPAFSGVDFVRVDFDTEKAFLNENRVPVQSVILVFRNGGETTRIVGVVDADELSSRIRAAAT
ncbi:MAG: thioredoxin family protein [Rhodomicrobiaceae bacterium]